LPNTNTPFWAKIRLLLLKLLFTNNHSIYEKTAEEYLLEGNQDFYKSKFDKAIEAYEKAIEIKPNYEAYYNL
jgi:tetratricopeptide (TPR) repeat protein